MITTQIFTFPQQHGAMTSLNDFSHGVIEFKIGNLQKTQNTVIIRYLAIDMSMQRTLKKDHRNAPHTCSSTKEYNRI